MPHHATKQIFRLLSFCCCVEWGTAGKSCASRGHPGWCCSWRACPALGLGLHSQAHPHLQPPPLLQNSLCQVQLVNRSQIRPTSCFQHMGSWRRGGCRAALQMCEMQTWSCREINRWFQVGKEMEKSCIVFSKRERECNLLCPAEFCSFWEGRQECRWWELQVYLVGYLVQLRLAMGCTTQGSDTGVPRSSPLMLNWGRRNTQNTGKND